ISAFDLRGTARKRWPLSYRSGDGCWIINRSGGSSIPSRRRDKEAGTGCGNGMAFGGGSLLDCLLGLYALDSQRRHYGLNSLITVIFATLGHRLNKRPSSRYMAGSLGVVVAVIPLRV